jgi:hypothetical protein
MFLTQALSTLVARESQINVELFACGIHARESKDARKVSVCRATSVSVSAPMHALGANGSHKTAKDWWQVSVCVGVATGNK